MGHDHGSRDGHFLKRLGKACVGVSLSLHSTSYLTCFVMSQRGWFSMFFVMFHHESPVVVVEKDMVVDGWRVRHSEKRRPLTNFPLRSSEKSRCPCCSTTFTWRKDSRASSLHSGVA